MRQIRLTKGLFALVSEEDYEYLMQWKWCASHESRGTKWYAVRTGKVDGRRKKIRMSHIVAIAKFGNAAIIGIFNGKVVDHINHNSLDNRRENIRVITQRENMLASPNWARAK